MARATKSRRTATRNATRIAMDAVEHLAVALGELHLAFESVTPKGASEGQLKVVAGFAEQAVDHLTTILTALGTVGEFVTGNLPAPERA